jgi:two-component system response regulator PhoP
VKTNAIPSPVRIAVVEDDEILREKVLIPILRKNGYEVVGFPDAGSLYAKVGSYIPHILILDVGLPDESGLAVARRLRVEPSMRILMLTGLREVPDHVRGLSNGADAYLSKPVEEDLLVATVESLVRRLDSPEKEAVGYWHIDADGWRLVAPNGRALDLMSLERALIGELVQNAGSPVPRETLIALLRNDEEGEFDPHRLEMIVHRLRRRASGAFGIELPLRAVRGIGYLFTTIQG